MGCHGVAMHLLAHEQMRRTARESDRRRGRQHGRGMGYLRTEQEFEIRLNEELQAIRQRYTVPG